MKGGGEEGGSNWPPQKNLLLKSPALLGLINANKYNDSYGFARIY